MGIFRKQEIDLSDEGLARAAEESNVIGCGSATDTGGPSSPGNPGEPPAPANIAAPEAGGREPATQPTNEPIAASADAAQTEQVGLWQSAAEEITAAWPQAFSRGRELVAKMVEIGSRYGDPQLWQRAPAGIMREAALELFGWPKQRDNEYAKIAAQAAREGTLREMSRRNSGKAGLEKPSVHKSAPPPLTEEDKILEEIRRARGRGIF